MTRKAAGFQDSGGRKSEVFIKVVSDGCGRERKPRTLSMVVPEASLLEFLESARSKGRARKRVKRKGRGCIERRKAARRNRQRDEGKGLSSAAGEFSPAGVTPPLPKEPEPGSALYRAVAERILAETGLVSSVKQDVDTDVEDRNDDSEDEDFQDAIEEAEGDGAEAREDAEGQSSKQ